MSRSGESWNIVIIFCVFLLLTTGCITQPPPKNVTSTLSDIFSAPIGGFVHPEKYTIQDSNTTFASEYVFYSRDWGGEVKYSVSGKYKDQIANDSSVLYVAPSSFTAEPNHVYSAKVYLNSSTIPRDFFIPQPDWVKPGTGILYSPYVLYINVSLDGTDSLFCNDNIRLQSFNDKPHPIDNYLEVETGVLSLKKGETKHFKITYSADYEASPVEISYTFSQTPLNVTIKPLHFIAKRELSFPSVVNITADSHLIPGQYPVIFSIQGVNDVTIGCDTCRPSDSRKKMFVVNVTVK